MPGRRSMKASREEGLERTDNSLDFTTWPQVAMINQKNYYTEYLKRDDQILALRLQNDETRAKMTKAARDKDREWAHSSRDLQQNADMDVDMEGNNATEEGGDPDTYGSKTVVIHPGSQNLRIGLASDILPKTVPMVVARKSNINESEAAGEEPYPKRRKLDDDEEPDPKTMFGEDFYNTFQALTTGVKNRMRRKGRRIVPNCREVAIIHNRKTQPTKISEMNDPDRVEWTEIQPQGESTPREYFTGQPALRIPDDSTPRYRLKWPIKYGYFNEADYASKEEIVRDITLILEDTLKYQLGIEDRKEWRSYSCVFVVPDLYDRNYVTVMLDLLFREFAFHRVCFIQEGVSGSFGAGFSTCVIVDVGAHKTSICCVDEGLCLENSRINLQYGGWDITETFVKMLLADRFPYSEINLLRRYDFLLAEELKRKCCTLSVNDFQPAQFDFHLRVAGQDTRHYPFRAYDEVILAPMGYYDPTIFDSTDKLAGRRGLFGRATDLYDGAPNDPTSVAQLQLLENSTDAAAGDAPNNENGVGVTTRDQTPALGNGASFTKSKATPQPNGVSAAADTPEAQEQGGNADENNEDGNMGNTNAQFKNQPLHEATLLAELRERKLALAPLSSAITLSISQGAKGDDKKQRDFFGGIIPVGGGAQVPFFNVFLEEELGESVEGKFKKEILISPPPRDIDPQVLVWKGASVFGKLQSTNDTWITGLEWDRLGARILAYKCLWGW